LLEKDEYIKMKQDVRKTIRPRLDHVRCYPMRAACRDKIEVISRTEVVAEKELIVV